MKVTYSEIIMDTITVFQVAGSIPPDACAISLDGTVYNLVPAYGGKSITLAVQGAHDMDGKEIDFLTKEDDDAGTGFRTDDSNDGRE